MVKMTAIKPIYLDGEIVTEGVEFETHEQHARELADLGYAVRHGRSSGRDTRAGEPLTQAEADKEKRLAETEAPTRRGKRAADA